MSEKYKCGKCGATFDDPEQAQKHAEICNPDSTSNASEPVALHQCSKCDAIFSDKNALNAHRKNCKVEKEK